MKKIIQKIIEQKLNRKVVLEKPKNREFGDFATPVAFSMAKELRKSPMIIAEELAKEFEAFPEFSKIQPIKGYINFHLSPEFLNQFANSSLNGEFGKGEKSEKILLEFVSANPTGPLHIGHTRGAVYGDTLLKIGRYLGYKIDSEYYVNDAGKQIELLGLSILYGAKGDSMEEPEEYYRGEYILDLAKEIFEENGEIEDISQLASLGKEKMLQEIKSNLSAVGIEFDNFVSEKELYSKWEESLKEIEKNGGIYQKDGKVWLNSSKFGDEKDRVVVRENGVPTYLAGDIIYHHNKFLRDYDRYINIWGADHHGYIARVKSAIQFLGFESEKLEVILTQMVSLLKDGKPYKMSKRAGNFILMRDVVDEVGADAIRFIFASKTPDTPLEFDVSDLEKQDSSNPIYYINYAHARIRTLLSKSSFSEKEIVESNFENLDKKSLELLFLALQLSEILEESFESREVQKLADYLKNLASTLHSFYNSQKIIESENEKAILKALLVVANSIKIGLKLMGIEAKERM